MMSEAVRPYAMKTKWFKSAPGELSCVEIGRLPHGDYAIRDSRFRANTVVVTEDELAKFFQAVKSGLFDKLVEVIR